MQFNIITIFPHILDSYLQESILQRAAKKKIIRIKMHDPRAFTHDRHRTVDDRPYGGGAGMVMKVEPLYRCLHSIKRKKKSRVILLAANGKPFTQRAAKRLTGYSQLIMVCGRYEGIDHRLTKFVDEELSIGPYVLTGGELPAAVIIDAVTRLLPGVLGDERSAADESFSGNLQYLEHPHYTRPEVFRGLRVPNVLRSGDHTAIKNWRVRHSRSN